MLLNPDGSLNLRYPFPGVSLSHDSFAISAAFAPNGDALISGIFRSVGGAHLRGLARLFSDGHPPGEDFLAQNGKLQFAPLEIMKILIPILDNRVVNTAKAFRVTLRSPSPGAILGAGPSTQAAWILASIQH